eukprot:401564-Pelagomonas_calceolata.AAC.1
MSSLEHSLKCAQPLVHGLAEAEVEKCMSSLKHRPRCTSLLRHRLVLRCQSSQEGRVLHPKCESLLEKEDH